jgi:hypothetical protein
LLATIVLTVLQMVPSQQELDVGWRVPFVGGAVAALVAACATYCETTTAEAHMTRGRCAGVRPSARCSSCFGYTASGSPYTFTTYMQNIRTGTPSRPL